MRASRSKGDFTTGTPNEFALDAFIESFVNFLLEESLKLEEDVMQSDQQKEASCSNI